MELVLAAILGLALAGGVWVFVNSGEESGETGQQPGAFGAEGEFIGSAGGRSFAPPADMRERVSRLFQPLAERQSKNSVKKGKGTLQEQLYRADIKLKASEFVMVQIGVVILFALIGLLRFGVGFQFIGMAIAGWFAPGFLLNFRIGRRLKAFNDNLGDTLIVLANALKAGLSFPQAISVVADKGRAPIRDEFDRVLKEINLGSSIEDALAKMVDRVQSPDLDLVVTAVGVNRQVGGNLAEVLENISHTIRERIRIKGEVSTLTAQARGSGQMISFMPVGLAIFLYFAAPTYFRPMTSSPIGYVMLGISGGLVFAGNAIIKKVVSIDI